MLKVVHLITGLAALLLSLTPSLNPDNLPFIQNPDALSLGFIGLLNLLLAPQLPIRHAGLRHQLQHVVSALLLLTALLQALVLLAPLPLIGGQPAILFSLACALIAVLLHLASNLRLQTRNRVASPVSSGDRETGTVKWFNTSKGFGFISRDCGDDIFVHFRAIRGEGHRVLVEGQRVEFSVMQREKGLQAEDVIAAPPARH